jgi:hypothetical protein
MTTTISALCLGGEWACAHGDFAGLRDVARRLEGLVAPPIREELRAVAEACRDDVDRASALWVVAERHVIGAG